MQIKNINLFVKNYINIIIIYILINLHLLKTYKFYINISFIIYIQIYDYYIANLYLIIF